ncbi:MAG: hypothetical protein ACPGOV_03535 [Magnetovibrionaceae bacterium]
MRKTLAAVFVALFVLTNPALAEDLQKKFALPERVQLAPMQLPYQSDRGSGVTAVTVFLKPHDPKWLGRICRHSPKVRDALLQETFARPFQGKGGKLALKGVGKRLVGPINKALGADLVKDVFVAQGALRMGTGSISKLPFTSASGCASIKELVIDGKLD